MKNYLEGCKLVSTPEFTTENNLYSSLLKRLYAINMYGKSKSGLASMQLLSSLFGSPEKQFQSIHIAGSNGKGSVTTKIAKALELSGAKVGLYTSPHISSYRERIQINGQLISEKAVTGLLSEIFSVLDEIKEKEPSTFFEITTLLAFRYFAQEKVDVTVIEVGLGGRLDATNIITPILSAITSLSLEHTSVLGKTLPEIAQEKAGIIKAQVPVVVGPRVPMELIWPKTAELDCECIQTPGAYESFDAENSATARTCLEVLKAQGKLRITDEAITLGCKARPPCRIEEIVLARNTIILDVAHNPDGLEHLFKVLQSNYAQKGYRIVCGLSANKEINECVKVLRKYGHAFHLVEAKNRRALPDDLLYQEFTLQGTPKTNLFLADTIEANLDLALQHASIANEVLVVCGSFFIMAPIRAHLGLIDPCDPFDLNEAFLPAAP